jgi:Predicted nucleotidyltransferases
MINPALTIPASDLRRLCQTYQVRRLAVFGSATTDRFTADSDVDLLVEFQPQSQAGMLTLSRMQRELADMLHRPVDLVPEKGLKPRIRDEVLASSEVVYEAA